MNEIRFFFHFSMPFLGHPTVDMVYYLNCIRPTMDPNHVRLSSDGQTQSLNSANTDCYIRCWRQCSVGLTTIGPCMWYHFDLDVVCNDCCVDFGDCEEDVAVVRPKVCHSMDVYWSVCEVLWIGHWTIQLVLNLVRMDNCWHAVM